MSADSENVSMEDPNVSVDNDEKPSADKQVSEEPYDETKNNETAAAVENTTTTTTTAATAAAVIDRTAAVPARPIKRARTAYFIFMDDKRAEAQNMHPGQGVATVARELGRMWAGINDQEREMYQRRAAEERTRVANEFEAWKRAGGGTLGDTTTADGTTTSNSSSNLIIPVARVRKICKLDPEVKGLSKEAIVMITTAAEIFTAKLGTETVKVAQIQNRRKLLPEDVALVCSTREQFMFLREDIADLTRAQLQDAAAAAAHKNNNAPHNNKPSAKKGETTTTTTTEAKVSSKPLTSYFAPKSKD